MAISTDSKVSIQFSNVEVSEYGLSKTLDNYTVDEIKNYIYCGAYNQIVRNFIHRVEGTTLQSTDIPLPFAYEKGNGFYTISKGENPLYNNYKPMGILWCESDSTTLDATNLSTFKIVTEMDAVNMIVNIPSPVGTNGGATSWTDNDDNKCYDTGTATVQLQYNFRGNLIPLSKVHPYMLFDIGNGEIIMSWLCTTFSTLVLRPQGASGATATPFIGGYNGLNSNLNGNNSISAVGGNLIDLGTPDLFPYNWTYATGYGTSGSPDEWGNATGDCIYYATGGTNYGETKGTYRFSWYINTKNNALLYWAGCGVKFTAGTKTYKPIIENGWVIGYTDNMDTPSELDKWTYGANNHGTLIPPSGAPSGDVETDMPLAYIGGTAGMVSFIKINEAGLASADDIAESLSRFDITTIGKDLLRNFVAFKCYAVLNIDDSVVRDIKVDGHTLKDSGDNALQGEYIGGVSPVDFSAGKIEPLYNDYRDYAPYTHIQMYVPFCGWFDLPSWCMGKEITGTMFTDIYNGTVKAVIYANKTVVAEVGGCCAFDIPFAAESTGMKAGAVISSALSTIAMTGATIAAPNIATGIAAVSSAANLISAANANGTTLKGVMGDGSNTNGLLHVYIKTTRPNSPDGNTKIPEQYKHEKGIPCFKQLTLTAGDGYTQILDANITGVMTDREKQMIIDGFRHGLIL